MLSRFTRMTSMSSQMIGGYSVFRDAPTAPKVVPKVAVDDHHFHNDHATYCRINLPLRNRSSSSGSDPFFGEGPSHGDQLNDLLDLDAWSNLGRLERQCSSGPFIQPGTDSVKQEVKQEDCSEWMEHFGPLLNATNEPEGLTSLSSQEDVDQVSSLVNWQAWDEYLGLEALAEVKVEIEPSFVVSPYIDDHSDTALVPEVKQEIKEEVLDPDMEKSCTPPPRRYNKRRSSSFYLCSDSSSNSGFFDAKRSIKKRGVIMKPHVDAATDRRRAMNRDAALRYRDKKRREKFRFDLMFRDLVKRNSTLKTQERRLQSEIARFKKKLQSSSLLYD